jgi:hypothetical protein
MEKSRRIILVIIATVLLIAFAFGFGRSMAIKNSKTGKTYTNKAGIEFTLNYIKFTDKIDNWGGANDNYWKSLPEDATENQLKNVLTTNSENHTFCILSYTAENVSDSDVVIDEVGTLDFDNGYTFSDYEGKLSYRVSPTGVWQDLPGGLKLKNTGEGYEFRAIIVVPKKIVNETDKPLKYKLYGREYNLR